MLKKAIPIILFFIFLVSGCASNPNINITDTTGQPLPDKYYHGQTVKKDFRFTYYYVGERGIKDLDQTIQGVPEFLPKDIEVIKRKNMTSMYLVIRVANPTGMPYHLYARRSYSYENGDTDYQSYKLAAASHLPYREYTFPLPFAEKFKRASLEVTITDSKQNSLFRVGKFEYSLY